MKLVQPPPEFFQVSLGTPVLGLLCQFQVFPNPSQLQVSGSITLDEVAQVRHSLNKQELGKKTDFPLKPRKVEAATGTELLWDPGGPSSGESWLR